MVLSSYNMMICVSVFVSDDDDDDKSHNEWMVKESSRQTEAIKIFSQN